ncbi:hypothetical protein Vadar_026469 [Vaccinium darrowii]|uniref:Uncharacterized protein n=1 Tax=Vaccinium darrowii TaxID=229202 RepID=A0ACB7Z0D0_9ERIC|nr:hypothetical protein Vadar_026469 [Vaccinium darrowii]
MPWALWTWYRNQDSQSKVGDQIYIVRQPAHRLLFATLLHSHPVVLLPPHASFAAPRATFAPPPPASFAPPLAPRTFFAPLPHASFAPPPTLFLALQETTPFEHQPSFVAGLDVLS